MSISNIGIKIADGTFYPIVDKDGGSRKKVILTTVKDDQSNVQIDLYEGQGEEISSNRYVGSLLIEDLEAGPAGEAEVELLVGVESDGNLMAQAQDLRSGESQSLNVSLESLSEDAIYDMPDFELDDEFEPWSDQVADAGEAEEETIFEEPSLSFDEEDFSTTAYDNDSTQEEKEEPDPAYIEPPRRRPLLLTLFIIFGIAAVAALSIFLFKIFEGPTIPPLEAQGGAQNEVVSGETAGESDSPVQKPAAENNTADSDTGGAAAVRDGPVENPPDTSGSASDTPGSATGGEFIGGVWYWISWGDTLWDISSSFYRNPWYYGQIAEENSIRNPDLIYAGSKIFIPKK